MPAALSSVVLQSFGEYLISVTDFPWSAALAILSGIYTRWLAPKSACQARHIWVTVARGSREYSAVSIQTTHRHQSVFRVGSALRRTISVLFRNIVPFGILAVVFILPIHFLPTILGFLEFCTLNSPVVVVVLALTVYVLFTLLLSATLVYGTISELRGSRAGIGECISRGFGQLFPVVAVGLLVAVAFIGTILLFILPGMVYGLILFVNVPIAVFAGITVAVMFWAAIPAAVVERPGILASLQRSRDLTRDNRWKLFGTLVVLVVFNIGSGYILEEFLGVGVVHAPISVQFLDLLVLAFYSALFAVAYHGLRIAKDGDSAEEIAAVFD